MCIWFFHGCPSGRDCRFCCRLSRPGQQAADNFVKNKNKMLMLSTFYWSTEQHFTGLLGTSPSMLKLSGFEVGAATGRPGACSDVNLNKCGTTYIPGRISEVVLSKLHS